MNESASTETPFFGTQLSLTGVSVACLCKAALQAEVLQDQHNVELRIWVRPPWEGGLGTQGPKYSRTITTPVRAPGSQEVDFLSQNYFAEKFPPSLPAIVSFASVSRGVVAFKNQVAAYRRHNNCQFEALENQAIRTQCAAGPYLNARENGSSLGQSVKIGQNWTWWDNFARHLRILPAAKILLCYTNRFRSRVGFSPPHYKYTHQ